MTGKGVQVVNRILLLVIGVYFGLPLTKVAEGMKCHVIINQPDEWDSIHEKCYESNKPNFTNHPDMNTTLEEFDFDDSCYLHCFYKGIDLLTPDGALKKDSAATYFKESELNNEVLGKMTTFWNSCLDETAKIGKSKGFKECKVVTLHEHCIGLKVREEKGLLERKC